MLLAGTLNTHLEQIDTQAQELLSLITAHLIADEGITEELKAQNQMEWIRRMNSIRNRAEEIVKKELIYV